MSKNRLNMRNLVALAIYLTGMIAFSGCEKDPFPLGTDNWNSIACIARITENSAAWSVCIMNKEGKNMRKIVEKSFGFPIPTRSYSGEQLLFTMDGLYFVGIDGIGLTLIEGANGNAGWSPDDKQIAYIKYSGDDYEISNNVREIKNINNGKK